MKINGGPDQTPANLGIPHAFASRFLQVTGNKPALQAILGHRSIQMTMRRIRLTNPRVVPLGDVALGTPRRITAPFVFWRDDGSRYTCFAGRFRQIAHAADAILAEKHG